MLRSRAGCRGRREKCLRPQAEPHGMKVLRSSSAPYELRTASSATLKIRLRGSKCRNEWTFLLYFHKTVRFHLSHLAPKCVTPAAPRGSSDQRGLRCAGVPGPQDPTERVHLPSTWRLWALGSLTCHPGARLPAPSEEAPAQGLEAGPSVPAQLLENLLLLLVHLKERSGNQLGPSPAAWPGGVLWGSPSPEPVAMAVA